MNKIRIKFVVKKKLIFEYQDIFELLLGVVGPIVG